MDYKNISNDEIMKKIKMLSKELQETHKRWSIVVSNMENHRNKTPIFKLDEYDQECSSDKLKAIESLTTAILAVDNLNLQIKIYNDSEKSRSDLINFANNVKDLVLEHYPNNFRDDDGYPNSLGVSAMPSVFFWIKYGD